LPSVIPSAPPTFPTRHLTTANTRTVYAADPKTRRISELSPDPEPEPYQSTQPIDINNANDAANLLPSSNSSRTKRQKPPRDTAASSECWDWMISTGNVHYACSTAGFVSYFPLREARRLRQNNTDHRHDGDDGSEELEVHGVGRVELSVQRGVSSSSSAGEPLPQTHTIVLENVLHIPGAICNGFSPLVFGGGMSCNPDVWVGGDGAWVATPFGGGMRLVLERGRKGGSEVVDGVGGYSFGVSVAPAELEGIVAAAQQGGWGVDGMVE
jgi:hypothetical protein